MSENNLTLGEILKKLEEINLLESDNRPKYIYFDFADLMPTGIDSWRGDYAELAISFEQNPEKSMTAVEFKEMLENSVGKEFHGYKGGIYTADKETRVWVANYRYCGSTGIVDIISNDYSVTLKTSTCEY